MVADFGTGGWRGRRELRLGGVQAGGLVLLVAGLASIPGYIVLETWLGLQATKAAWAITGAPCAEVERPAANVLGKKPLKHFTYGGVRFSRKTGHVDCIALPEDSLPWERTVSYRICQFTGPGLVGVTLDGRTRWFQPGWGKPVTVTLRGGRLSCVVGGWFRA